jgi:hypothetical protein
MLKSKIKLSDYHPSLLESNFSKLGFYSPIIVNQEGTLVDGYRRFMADSNKEIETIEMNCPSIYRAAVEFNRNTRSWDEVDLLLWRRWARDLRFDDSNSSNANFPPELENAPIFILKSLADRQIEIGQAIRILNAPKSTWQFFLDFLIKTIHLNTNETSVFIEMTFDLANRMGKKSLPDVFRIDPLPEILNDATQNMRKKGEVLLKEMRRLRYPLYTKKSEALSTAWRQLSLEKLRAKKSLFLDRGVLEITIRARSHDEMSDQVRKLFESLGSPAWDNLWKNDEQI